MMWVKFLRENVQAFSTDIRTALSLSNFQFFGEFLSLSFHLSIACVLAVISDLYMGQTPSFMIFIYLCI